MKVSILTGSNSRNAGGLFYSVKSLALELSKTDNLLIEVVSHDDEFSQEDLITWGNLKMKKFKIFGPPNLGLTFDLKEILNKSKPDIIHQQGIWTFSSFYTNLNKKNNQSVSVITPRGMLDPWAISNSSFKKKIAGFIYENSNLKNADCIHALCESEYKSIRSLGLKNPVAIIPNGVYLPPFEKNVVSRDKKVLLYIGRIHPKKGLPFLINVINKINLDSEGVLENWEIRIAGWSQNNHLNVLRDLTKKYNLNSVIKFIGPVYGTYKEYELSNADAFILPSYSEGLPMSILEAWSYNLPVLMTEECNIPRGFDKGCGIKISHDIDYTVNIMKSFMKIDTKELHEIGNKGRELVEKEFSWSHIASMTNEMYKWFLNKEGDCPNFIRLN